ncbi:MAG: cytochrome P450 [Hyphomonas sp.]|mgnify:FL=1|jgi:cytochrome P450|uniref:cytochrome P450 n=2 Tax=Hyphomonas sp. TaxID=87 RepID=UPI0032673E02
MQTDPFMPKAPPHIPAELIVPFDFRGDKEYSNDPHKRLDSLRDDYRAFYTPFPRGMGGQGVWVFTRAEDIRAVLKDPQTFASGGLRPFAKAIGEDWTLIPVDLDPPIHSQFRTLLNPVFSPKSMKSMELVILERAEEMTTALTDQKEVDFVPVFARPYPVSIFLELLGLPLDGMEDFIEIEENILQNSGDAQIAAIRQLRDYLAGQIDDRRRNRGDDLISFAVHAEVAGRPLTDDEVMGICVMMFIGGLDTVTSTLGYHFLHLARHPEEQQRLRNHPLLIPGAVEELLRVYNVVTTGRRATRDVEIAGVRIRAGDLLALPTTLASRDPNECPHASEVDLDRESAGHSAFGFGPHRCIGSHLARRELTAALTAWTTRLPMFRLKEATIPRSSGSGVIALESLPLVFL